jgi:predicted nucleotidyltransferase
MNVDLVWAAARVKEWAEQQPAIYTVAFFGSRVKGTHREDSDLDVAVGTDWTSMVCNSECWTTELEAVLDFRPIRLVPLEDAVERYVGESGPHHLRTSGRDVRHLIVLDDDDPLWKQLGSNSSKQPEG